MRRQLDNRLFASGRDHRAGTSYAGSDPAKVTHEGTPPVWRPDTNGNLRIWTKDGDQTRNARSIDAPTDPGDYMGPGIYPDVTKLGFSVGTRVVTVYVEAISAPGSPPGSGITATLYTGGDPPRVAGADAVRASGLGVRAVSRDKFMAGQLEIPPGIESMEVEFVNTSTGENLGRYAHLTGGGTTKVYGSIEEIMSDADLAAGGQSDGQKVWFVKAADNPSEIDFYTCFNDVGRVEVRVFLDGSRWEVFHHTLAAAEDFAAWIAYVDNWVKGVGFNFGGPPVPTRSFESLLSPPAPLSGPLDNLTRACLIPLFNVISQVEGMEAIALGVLEGAKNGLNDDWDLVLTVKTGAVFAGNWSWTQAENELIQWRDNPVKRALELKRVFDRLTVLGVFAPIREVDPELSTWDGFKRRAWGTWDSVKGGASKAWTVGHSMSQYIAGGLVTWFDDFNRRMVRGGERVAFQNTPWNQDPLVSDLADYGRQSAYTFGYVFGYLCEQAVSGALTGGGFTLGQVMLKGGVVLSENLASKALVQIASRSHLLKKQLATAVLTLELRSSIEKGLVNATKMPVSSTILDSAGVVVETHLSKTIVNRNLFNLKTLVDAAVEMPNTRRLFEQTGTDWVLARRFALFMRLLGDEADDQLLNNFLRIFDGRIVVTDATGAFEWTEDFLRCFKVNMAEFLARPPLDPFAEDAVAQLKKLCGSPNPGYIWKLDDEPPDGPWLRGIIAELDLYYHEYRSWTHLPTDRGVDFVKDARAVQLKTTPPNSSSTIGRMKTALRDLRDASRSRGCSEFTLDIRRKPGLDTSTMQSELDAYVRSPEFGLLPGEHAYTVIQDYELIPPD